MTDTVQADVTNLAVTLLSAYVSNNNVPANELAGLIESTRKALIGETAPAQPAPQEFAPATTVRKSLASREHILSMIDGKPYRTLKRHLSTHGLTPAEYRARYNLARDYPLVAPAYSEARRETAKTLGLGRKPAVKVEVPAAPADKAAPAAAKKAPTKPAGAKAGASPVTAEAASTAPAKAAPNVKAAAPKAAVAEPKADAVAAKPATKAKAKAKTKAATKSAPAVAAKKPTAAKAESNGAAPAPKPRKKLSIAVPQAETDAPKAA